jgi:hypothetical protein
LQCHSVSKTRFKNRYSKTNAQKKWAVKTRPFGREALIVTCCASRCKQFPCLERELVWNPLMAAATASHRRCRDSQVA